MAATWLPIILLVLHTGTRGWGGGGGQLYDQGALGWGWQGPHLLQGNPGVLNRWTLIDLLLLPLSACAHRHTHHTTRFPHRLSSYGVPNPSCMTWKLLLTPNDDFMGSRRQGKQIKKLVSVVREVLRLWKSRHPSISSLPEATSEVGTSQLCCIFFSHASGPLFPRYQFLSIFTGS